MCKNLLFFLHGIVYCKVIRFKYFKYKSYIYYNVNLKEESTSCRTKEYKYTIQYYNRKEQLLNVMYIWILYTELTFNKLPKLLKY
ncbi:hypothetical protein EHRUM3_00790 [Ehrlichia ruminantium]|uniref:Uncharacterized protein n=1 Tax=Ehrlichia ruminantium TaxID=779 RepID=A0A161M6I2_EHRRU|nr:hypothetical protein EHRUM3_00790 [Ehrlichia ruminantium]